MFRRTAFGLLAVLLAGITCVVTGSAAVAADRDCGDFSSQRAAQIFFLNNGGPQSDPHRLDSDGDGVVCESNPGPYYYGTSLPDAPTPQPQVAVVRSAVSLTVSPTTRIAGESFKIAVSVRPAISRRVVIERKVDGRWRSFASRTTATSGRTTATFRAPGVATAYRAVVKAVTKGNRKYSGASSQARSLRIQRQQVVLSFANYTVEAGEQARALVTMTPIRSGRPVALRTWSEGSWTTVATSVLNSYGRARFSLPAELGDTSYRAVVLAHRGAAAAQSSTRTVTGVDLTAPPVPTGLSAAPGDGTVQLTWIPVLSADLSHYQVLMRTADSGWTIAATTNSSSVQVSAPNGVPHWFTVASVDHDGNVSAMAAQVTATPLPAVAFAAG
ncbi:excalibur calcium-binding domain-containing protein [Nocardioides caeni]|uniref:excalibur calcium-binding domain-containing protein n=1 Tax=Nocardioides caeni TaxID=574700 RepID=UPI0019310556|nr:excalibur calcium-binding domain-containing protein [Nocardioides caeni]